MEGHALAEREGVGQAVLGNLPRLGEGRLELQVSVQLDEPVVDLPDNREG